MAVNLNGTGKRFGATIPVLNEFRWLPSVTGQLLKVCDRVVLLRCVRSFSGAQAEIRPLPRLDPRVEVVLVGGKEHDVRNVGIDILTCDASPCDYVFTVDSDEVFTDEALKYITETAARGHRAVACYFRTYWKTPRYEILPPDRIPCVIVVSKDVRFRYLRAIEGEPHVLPGTWMHHLSYVRTDEEVQEKLRLYGHAHQVHPAWFVHVWKRWDEKPDLTNLHPIHPNSFGRAEPVVVDELEAILKEHGVQ